METTITIKNKKNKKAYFEDYACDEDGNGAVTVERMKEIISNDNISLDILIEEDGETFITEVIEGNSSKNEYIDYMTKNKEFVEYMKRNFETEVDKNLVLQKIKQVYNKNSFQNAGKNHEYLENIGVDETITYKIDKNYSAYFGAKHGRVYVVVLYRGKSINVKNYLKKNNLI